MLSSLTMLGSVLSATAWTLTEPRRGELWLMDFGELLGHEQGWRRTALVVSSDEWNRHATTVTVVAVKTSVP